MTELKPCPFCGKRPQLLEPDDSNKLWSVSCLSCVSIDLEELTEERASQKWNTRHYPPEIETAIERDAAKKPVPREGTPWETCPNCGSFVVKVIDKVGCSNCLQRLDWGE